MFNLHELQGGKIMIGREKKEDNDLFFVCSLIEYIARLTGNKDKDVVNAIGISELTHVYNLADIYHSDNINRVASDLIKKCQIKNKLSPSNHKVSNTSSNLPSHWDIGKVYKRLITDVSKFEKTPIMDALIKVYNSWITDKIRDYNSSMYYENPSYLLKSYIAGKPL